jgi:hypothetical protein
MAEILADHIFGSIRRSDHRRQNAAVDGSFRAECDPGPFVWALLLRLDLPHQYTDERNNLGKEEAQNRYF